MVRFCNEGSHRTIDPKRRLWFIHRLEIVEAHQDEDKKSWAGWGLVQPGRGGVGA